MIDHEQIRDMQAKYNLTFKQALFVYYYTGNQADACRKAGYAGNNTSLSVQGNKLLKLGKIKQALQGKTLGKGDILSPDQILKTWSLIAIDPTVDSTNRLRSLENLAKAQGMFIDRSINLNMNKHDRIDRLSDHELDQLIDQTIDQLVGTRETKLITLEDQSVGSQGQG